MPKRQNDPARDSKILNQIAKLIDVRLPTDHGFALLTFPLGATVNPRMRYIGKGDRGDIMRSMQHWLDHQAGVKAFGHSDRPAAEQWHTQKPTVPGMYLLRSIDDHEHNRDPDFVKLSQTGVGLRIDPRGGDQWDIGFDFVSDINADHQWLGPIPEPWTNARPPAPDSAMEATPEPVQSPVSLEGPCFLEADNPEDREAFDARLENIIQVHGEDWRELRANLMRNVPKEGGNVDYETIVSLIQTAFQSGVLAQFEHPVAL